MTKRLATIFIALSAFALLSVPAMAQMTDDAVTSYVKEALASGKSQQTIQKELVSRGVTKDQAERIKKNLEQSRNSASVSSVIPVDRSRKISNESSSHALVNGIMTGVAIVAPADSTEFVADSLMVFGRNIFTLFDDFSAMVLLPVGGLLISIFAGWVLDKKFYQNEISNGGTLKTPYFRLLVFSLRYLSPVAIGLIFLDQLGVFKLFS